ncbi:hypothetical protein L596_008228 [Steinernema carpocapsae]|uniref:Uncharacterized protein n=1 Tax=Steinernema carpocapsae TaxID=34508 RepID=A0A4U5PC45_STECR|nr:hypothetical protein L596_008228 [Steinernema carpocapsae]
MEIALTSKRCLCVHATLQMVDVILKSVLFQRQFVPDVVARLLETNEKFADDYAKVADVLRDCFRSRNRELIQEVVIVVGPTCYAPREFFRIPIHVCQEEQDEPSTSGCGSRCGELTDREIMAFYRTMMTNFPVDDFKKLKRTDRAYIMLNAGESLQLSSFEDMSADESFSLPMANSVRKPPLLETTIKMSHECESPGGGQKTAAAKPSCWFRVVPHFKVIS